MQISNPKTRCISAQYNNSTAYNLANKQYYTRNERRRFLRLIKIPHKGKDKSGSSKFLNGYVISLLQFPGIIPLKPIISKVSAVVINQCCITQIHCLMGSDEQFIEIKYQNCVLM